MNNIQYKLRVSCMTFNHSKYITDAMNGFCMQQTDFPFVCTIIDDASTDGEQEVLRNYVKEHFDLSDASVASEREDENAVTTFAQHKENRNCFFAVIYLKENHYSKAKSKLPYVKEWNDSVKYIALCEGDDYWTDPYKLQKQVDFLEGHEEYDMVCGRFNHLDDLTGEIKNYDLYDDIIERRALGLELRHEHFLNAAIPHPCTVMYRQGTMYDNNIIAKLKYRFDYPAFWCFMIKHRVWLMNEKVSVYRKHDGSLTTRSDYGKNFTFYEMYRELYNIDKDPILKELFVQKAKGFLSQYIKFNMDLSYKMIFDTINEYWRLQPEFKERLIYLKRFVRAIGFRVIKGEKYRQVCQKF